MEVRIDPKLLEQLEGSTCFSIAHDATSKECKMCDLQQECSAKSAGNNVFDQIKILKPETQEAMDKAMAKRRERDYTENDEGLSPRQLRKKRKREEREKIGMPATKGLPTEELWEILKEVGGTCDVYDNERTQKMRLTLEIKKAYLAKFEESQKDELS